jgi:ribonuclease J
MKLMINVTQPRYVMPMHGDHRRIRLHSQMAESLGVHPEDIFRGENGLPLEIDERGARFGTRERAGLIFVDGVDIGDPEDIALRDRKTLSADGILIVVATIGEQDGHSVAEPELIFRGVPFIDGSADLLAEIRSAVDESLARSAEEEIREISLLQDHLHDDIAKFVYDRLRRRPMVLPVVVEV